MSTIAQINANTANAQKSTGPRTAEGKSASSRNAIKYGIFAQTDVLPGEDPEAFQQLFTDYTDELKPEGIVETQLVSDIVRAIWLDLRFTRVEGEVIRLRAADLPEDQRANPTPHIFNKDPEGVKILDKLDRRRSAARRQLAAAQKELRRLQSERRVPEPQTKAQPTPKPEPKPVIDTEPPSIYRLRSTPTAAPPISSQGKSPNTPALRP
jgi:hypothetical protein